jgi:hypothetical protein
MTRMAETSRTRAWCDGLVARHPVLVVALLVLATFALCLLLLYRTAPRVIYEFF